MIYGPKRDGTYIVEFKTADGEALAISVPAWRDSRAEIFPRANAVRSVRAGCSLKEPLGLAISPPRSDRIATALLRCICRLLADTVVKVENCPVIIFPP